MTMTTILAIYAFGSICMFGAMFELTTGEDLKARLLASVFTATFWPFIVGGSIMNRLLK